MDPSNNNNKCIYAGNLPHEVTDQLLLTVFGHFGQCVGCHIMRDFSGQINPYAFIEFTDHQSASLAVAGMNNISLWGHQLKVNWASGSQGQPNNSSGAPTSQKIDYSKAIQIFVGDIGLDVNEQMLKEAFSQFGSIIDAKVVRYPDGQSKGFAFLSFTNRVDAESAINSMHKTWLHNRTIKCNWATRNGGGGGEEEQYKQYVPRPYELVHKESPLSNTNVYVAGVTEGLTEELVRCHFEEFGRIDSVKVFPEKAYAFINYGSHEAAARAISQRHGYKINNNIVKCNWGKENFGFPAQNQTAAASAYQNPSTSSATAAAADQYQYYQQYCQFYNNPQMQEYYKQFYNQYYQQQHQLQQENQTQNQ